MADSGKALVMVGVMGPTGTGKSEIAERLADYLDAVLINADAFQVYQGLDIGTNKPPVEVRGRYKLLDVVPVTHEYGVGEWIRATMAELEEAYQAGRHVVVVGGTGFYIRALFEEYDALMPPPDPELRAELESRELEDLLYELKSLDPNVYEQTDRNNKVRVTRALEKIKGGQEAIKVVIPPFKKVKFGLLAEDDALKGRLEERFDTMVQNGWIDEVKEILLQKTPIGAPGLRAIGYHHLIGFCEGTTPFGSAKEEILTETWQYAKRQKTWMRSEPGLEIVTVSPLNSSGLDIVFQLLKSKLLQILG